MQKSGINRNYNSERAARIKRLGRVLAMHLPWNLCRAIWARRGRTCPVVAAALMAAAWCQSVTAAVVQGRVEDAASGKPLEGAAVRLLGTDWGASADRTGRFILSTAPPGNWTVEASHLGFKPAERPVALGESDTLTLDFRLVPAVLPLEEVVLTATRTRQVLKSVPVATELVRKEDIRAIAAQTAAEALSTRAGLEVREDFSGQGVTLQGVDPDKVLILVDGNRVVGRVNGSLDLDQISAGGIKQIEVVKGAVSTLYGSEALGGVINIITEPATAPLEAVFDFSAGGYLPDPGGSASDRLGWRSTDWSPAVNLGIRRGDAAVRAGGRYQRIGLVDTDPSTSHTDGRDETDRLNADLRADWDFRPHQRLTLTARFMDEDKFWIEDDQRLSYDLSYDDREDNRRTDGAVEWQVSRGEAEQLSLKGYLTGNRHHWRKMTQAKWGEPRVVDYSRNQEDYGELSLNLTRRLHPRHLVTAGADLSRWMVDAESKFGNVDRSAFQADFTTADAYLQDEFTVGAGVTLLPGLRYERHEVYGDNWSPRLSAMWAPRRDVILRASVGWGYRAPSAKELYYVFNHISAGYIVQGNPDLRPEHSENYSVSLEHHYRDQSVGRVTFYRNNLHDLITFQQVSPGDDVYPLGKYRYGNVYAAWTQGVELERSARLARGLEASVAYTYLDTRNAQTGNQLIHRARHSGRWTIVWRRFPWSTTLWGSYLGRRMFADISDTPAQESDIWAEAYQTWNLALTRDLGRGWQGYLKVENLADVTHPRHGPRVGRVAAAGLRLTVLRE